MRQKILLIIPPQKGDDIMSTPEYVQSLLNEKKKLWMSLSDFTLDKQSYSNLINRLYVVDKELAFYGLT